MKHLIHQAARGWLAVASLALLLPAWGVETWRQDRFLITFWCPPPVTDEALARVAAEGFNLTWSSPEGLDVVARHNLRALLQSEWLKPEVLDDPDRRAQLDALLERVKAHPALEGYYLTDEPGAGAFAAWGRLAAYLRERDPRHFAYLNLYPTYANEEQLGVSAAVADRARVGYPTDFAGVQTDGGVVLRYREHVRRFLETVKPALLSYDHYHFLQAGPDGEPQDGRQYFLNLGLIRREALEAGVPFLNIIQANTIEKSWRLPTGDELRWLVFTTLAYGGRGISYFTYWGPPAYNGLYVDGRPQPLLEHVVKLNRELAALGPTLMALDSLGAYQTPPLPYGAEAVPTHGPVQVSGSGGFVLGLFGHSNRPSAFLLVNRDYRAAATAEVTVAWPGRRLEEFDRTTGVWSAMDLGSGAAHLHFTLTLQPGDGRLFRAAP